MSIAAIREADVFYFGSDFHYGGRAFDFKVFNDHHGVPILQDIAVGIFDDIVLWRGVGRIIRQSMNAPLVRTFRAYPKIAILVNIF